MLMGGYHIAIVGATGVAGSELLRVLERRNFPVATLRPIGFPRAPGFRRNLPSCLRQRHSRGGRTDAANERDGCSKFKWTGVDAPGYKVTRSYIFFAPHRLQFAAAHRFISRERLYQGRS